jgi:tetratricopeptide (TPR) repeat protein
MSRGQIALIWFAMACPALAGAQQSQPPKEQSTDQQSKQSDDNQISPDQLPPDEDVVKPEQHYSFNPVQSKKEVTVGEFYFKKNDFRAAAGRFREGTKWNDGNADAWLRLGDAEEKMKDTKAAREAWEKYLQLAPDAKNAPEVRRKLGKG